jgi:hypothetical protein
MDKPSVSTKITPWTTFKPCIPAKAALRIFLETTHGLRKNFGREGLDFSGAGRMLRRSKATRSHSSFGRGLQVA